MTAKDWEGTYAAGHWNEGTDIYREIIETVILQDDSNNHSHQ